jgi:hypothetical protein
MRNMAARKASSQYLRGMEACAKRARPISNDMTVLAFNITILLVGMWARGMVCNADRAEKGIKLLILTALIGLNCKKFVIKHAFNKRLKFSK